MAARLLLVVLQLTASCYAFRMLGRFSSRTVHQQLATASVSMRPTSVTTGTRLMMMSEGGDDTSRGLVSVAKTFASTNLGVSNPSLLTADFVCSGPDFVCGSKDTYVAGLKKETEVFQKAMPDFDLRPYGFMVDETSPDTVWFKIRPRGTITGPFVYKGEVYAPNNKVVELPIQQLSVTIRGAQVGRVTAGYIVDRQSGNPNPHFLSFLPRLFMVTIHPVSAPLIGPLPLSLFHLIIVRSFHRLLYLLPNDYS